MKKFKSFLAVLLSLVLIMASMMPSTTSYAATAKETQSITLNVKSKVTMYVGTSKKITVNSVTPKGSSKKVIYESSNPAVLKVTSSGNMKALTEGQATITVTSASNKKVTKKVKVAVKNLVKNTIEDKVVIPLDKKKSFKMSLAVKATNLTFTSSKKSVAVVEKKGVVKAKKAGTARITVKGKKGAAKGAKQTVTVYVAKKSVKRVSLNVKKKVLKPGKTFTLKTKVNPGKAANVVIFKSSKPSVATVSSKGKVKAVKVGTAKITAITIDGKKKAVCTVVVAKKTSQTEPTTEVKPTTAKPTTKPSETTKEDTTTKSSETTKEEPTTKPSETTREDVTTAKPGETTKKEEPTTKADETTTSKQESTTTAKQEGTTTSKQESTTTAKQEGTTEAGHTTEGTTEADQTTEATTEIPGDADIELPDVTNAVDSDTLTNEGIQIANSDETLYLGEFIAINAFCFPYAWSNENNYVLESSDTKVVTVDRGQVAYAVGVGEAQITAYTLDGKYKDTIDVKVLPEMEHSYSSSNVYVAETEKFGLVCHTSEDDPLNVSAEVAYGNCDAIMSMLRYAQTKGYDVVKLPAGKVIYIDPANTIYMKSGISLDLNGSELRIIPNAYTNYQAIVFKEGNINAFAGFASGTATTYDKYTDAKAYTFQSAGDSFLLNPILVCEKDCLYDAGNYSGKWLEKGSSVEVVTSYVRDKNANIVIYAHYLKAGAEVGCDKISGLNGVSNDTLINVTQIIQLSSEYDYDSMQLEFRAGNGDVCNYTFCDMQLRTKPTEILNDASIVNGTITGERSTKDSTYPNWKSDSKTEGSCSIIFNQGVNNGIKNLTVKDSVGFNMSSGNGSVSNRVYVPYTGLELGAYDDNGNKIDSLTMIRNTEYYDVTNWKTDKYTLGYPFGYQSVENWSHSRIYDVYYYDENKNLISFEKGIMKFREYKMPEGTCFINIAMYDSEVPTSGDSDFGNSILMLEERDIPIRNFIIDCTIENNYSTGFAACGGQRWIIEGNTWRNNGGRMPGCDIDWEDGWNYMQCDMISNNEFLSYNNVITCAGMYSSVFNNNKFYGITWMYSKCNFYSFVNNSFIKDTDVVSTSQGRVNFATRSDVWIYNNTFSSDVVTNELCHSGADYRIRFIDNHFVNGYLVTNDRIDVTGCDFAGKTTLNTNMIDDCTFTDCNIVAVSGTIKNSKMKNVTISPLKGYYENCELEDVTMEVILSEKNSPIIFDNCNIKSGLGNFITVGPYVYSTNYMDLRFQNCTIQHTGENLIHFVSTPNENSQILFENCTLNKTSGYIAKLFSHSSLSEASVDIKFTGTEVNENLLMDERIDSTKVRVQY